MDLLHRVDARIGPVLDRWRGRVPRALLVHWIKQETGGDALAVSRDPVLIECGLSQAPLARARDLDCDPFDMVGGCWLACYEAEQDAQRWQKREPRWLALADRNLWYACEMDYSVGTGGLRHIIQCATSRAESAGRGPSDLGLMAEILAWERVADLSLPNHRRWWGRQKPSQIRARIRKHAQWIAASAALGEIDHPMIVPGPGVERPVALPCFPRSIEPQADVCELLGAPMQKHANARLAVIAYRDARRKRDAVPKAPILFRLASMIRPDRWGSVGVQGIA